MNKPFVVLGVIVAAVGAAAYYVSSYTDLLGGRTHHVIPLGGLGLAVLGVLMLIGGFMMGTAAAKTADQFKCSKCGAVFGSQTALDQHSKDKHGIQPTKP